MDGIIGSIVAIQQVKLDATHLNLPSAQPNGVTGQRDLEPQPLAVRLAQWRDRQLSGVVIRIEGLLRAILVYQLPKVALGIEQSHADNGNSQVASRFHLIAGDVAQSAGVDGQRFAQHELHAEIRHGSEGGMRMIFLKPRRVLGRLTTSVEQIVDSLAKSGIAHSLPDLVPRDCLQNNPRIVREIPQHGIQPTPHGVCGVVPR
jgi:hypothetical protein